MKLFNIVSKNLKLLLKSKGSSIIILLGPLLIIFLVGIAFGSTNAFSINIGVYSKSYSELTNSYIESLGDKQFNVKKYDTQEFCVDEIKKGKLQACIIFPQDMTFEKEDNEIVFHVDYSKINIVWVILDTINKKLGSKSEEYSKELTQVLIDKLKETQTEINDKGNLLVTIKNENNEVITKIQASTGSLDSLSLNVDVNSFKVQELTDKNTALQSEMTGFENDTLAKVTSAESDLSNIKSELETINTSELSDAISYTNSALVKVDYIKDELTDTLNFTDKFNTELASLITSLQANVDAIKSSAEKASNAKSSLSSDLSATKQKINTILNNIIEIQKAFYKIDESIKAIKVTDVSKIVSPISTRIEPISSEETHLNYMFPSLIILVVMFVSILLSSTIVIMEKNSKAYFRNFISPTKDITFIAANFLTALVIMIFQVIIIVLIAWLFFKIQIISTLVTTSLVLLIAISFFILLGMLIGYIFSSEETATLAAVSVSAVFLLLSSVIFPIESMSGYVQKAAKFNPFVISELLLRQALLYKESVEVQLYDILFLLAYVLLIFGIIYIGHQIVKKHFVSKYSLKLLNITHFKESKPGDRKKKEQPPNIKL